MAHRRFRWLGMGVLATGGAGILGITALLHPVAAIADETDYALILGPGGFGDTTDLPRYVAAIDSLYLENSGVLDGATGMPYSDYPFNLVPVDTPEGIIPTSLGDLSTQTVTAIGDLNTAIGTAIDNADGGQVTVFGFSESATTSILLQEELQAEQALGQPLPYSPDQLSFILVGDPSNPDGGLYERLIPSLATDLPYHTDIYTQEYDGFADFPKYPIDTLADLNAAMGTVYDHLTYADLTASQIADAIPMTSTDPNGDYFIIPTDDLPLLEPLRLLGAPGNAMADLLQPDATLLVNLGYGNLSFTEGYDLGPANVPTAFGIAPDVDMSQLGPLLVQGWQEGLAAATSDIENAFSYSFGTSPALTELTETAYTFGLTSTPDASITELLAALQQFGLDELGSLGAASSAEALTSGALDATPLASLLSDFTTDFLSQLPGLF